MSSDISEILFWPGEGLTPSLLWTAALFAAKIDVLMKKGCYYGRLFRILRSYKRKKVRLSYLPVRLWIEPTSVCNLRCIMCPNKDLEKSQKGFMEFELFKKIVDEARGFVFDVHLLHRGESLLHPDFFKMVRYAQEAGLVTRFHTNGTLLDEEKSYELIESGLDQFAFSFDGYDQESYERIRVPADFEETVGNIVRFLEIKKRLKARRPYTIIELIHFPELFDDKGRTKLKEFKRRFQGLPLDKLVVKELHNWAGDYGAADRGKTYSPCTFLWHALIIFWDGSVLPCTQDFFGYYGLGNVKETSIADIWNSEKMMVLRGKVIRGKVEDLETCSQCDRLWRKQFLGIPRDYLGRFLLKKMD
jgi:radical SAM protein with 4Fe4S-binding SPASM domain